MGPPRILQCDNRREFKGAVLHILQWHGITLINSNPQHPQSQGLVEQANSVVERKLRALTAERGTRKWSSLLVEISIAMHSSGCVKANCTCTMDCHPRGTSNGICCNKPSRVGEGEDEEANATDQAGDREDDDSEDREAADREVEELWVVIYICYFLFSVFS